MKKFLTLIILTSSAALLHADYYGYQSQYPDQTNSYQNGQYGYGYQDQYQNGQYQQGQSYPQYQYQQGNQQYQDKGYRYQNQNGQQSRKYQQYRYDDQQNGQSSNGASSQMQNQDQTLTKQIQNYIQSDRKFSNVKFSVNNGNVILQGTVRSEDEKDRIEDKIDDMSGVRDIDNQIQVQGNNSRGW